MQDIRRLLAPIAIIIFGLAALSAGAYTSPPGNETINYSYDTLGRLVKVDHSGTVNNNVVSDYAYDKADNRTNVNVTGAP